jgi:two-component system, NtrC family, nitrogen regulation sensor histidine kinase NtrY
MTLPSERPREPRVSHEQRVLLLSLGVGLPGTALAMIFLWTGDFTPKVQWTLSVFLLGWWFAFAFTLRERVVRPLQTLSNLLAALLEGDYSIRSRGASADDALGLALLEINSLGETLREQRMGAREATALLRKVMDEIEVAIFTFDEDATLRLVNRAGERLLGKPGERLLGRQAEELGLGICLAGAAARTLDVAFPGGLGRWELRRSSFWQGGHPHTLVVLADLSRTLREEERKAWQRLVRVLGHEINNSLAPIKSIAGSLQKLMLREPRPADADEDLRHGLAVIAGRSEALARFMTAYARLARLPAPRLQPLEVEEWIRRVAGLEMRLDVQLVPGPPLTIQADGDQLDQVLINLIGNAVDASLETGGAVRVGWARADGHLEVWVDDDGPGLADTANLFVPFFTTKPQGSGIGLALSRQIAEAHGGGLTLANRREGPGCRARLRLPLDGAGR